MTSSALPSPASSSSYSSTASPSSDVGGARLLVVDDEQNIRDLLSETLRLVGFDITVAADGVEALNAVRSAPPDLVVLDVMLPDMDGYEVARMLRHDGREVPVLFLTARDTVRDRVEGLSAGGDDYVTKPFSLEEVVLPGERFPHKPLRSVQ